MRIQSLLVLMVGLSLFILGCSESNSLSEPTQSEITDRVAMLMGGWPHAKAITETGKATAFRIGRDGDHNEVILSDGIALTDAQRQDLVNLLARDDAYEWDMAKGCMPLPGVLITFEDGATFARVRFCFSCEIVEYKPGSSEDFDPINAELVDWAKGVFPDDEAIQGLGTDDEVPGL